MYQQKGRTEASRCQARSQPLRLRSSTVNRTHMLYRGGLAPALQRVAQQI